MKQPIDHFSLSDYRKSIETHEHPLFTLTKGEVEGLVSRLEKAELLLLVTEDTLSIENRWRPEVTEWLVSLERAK